MRQVLAAFTQIKQDTFISTHKQLKRNIDEETKEGRRQCYCHSHFTDVETEAEKVSSWQEVNTLKINSAKFSFLNI